MADLESSRAKVLVLTERERSFSDVSGASQLAATLQLSEELEKEKKNDDSTSVRKLGSDRDKGREIGRGRDDNVKEKMKKGNLQSNSTEMLITEISRLTTSLEIKEEALRHMQLQLQDAGRNSGIDDSRSFVGGVSPYKEMFANSEAEMHRLKVIMYSRSRIKYPLFVPKTQTPWVTSKSPHTIRKKQKIWGTFLFLIFSMVWAPLLTMPHTFELNFGHEKQTFYSATIIIMYYMTYTVTLYYYFINYILLCIISTATVHGNAEKIPI